MSVVAAGATAAQFAPGAADAVGGLIDSLFGGSPNNQGERSECEKGVMAGRDRPPCAGVGGRVTGISTLSRRIQRKARSSQQVARALSDLVNGQGLEFQGTPPRNLEEAANYAAWAIKNADAGGGGAVTTALKRSSLRQMLQQADTSDAGGGASTAGAGFDPTTLLVGGAALGGFILLTRGA